MRRRTDNLVEVLLAEMQNNTKEHNEKQNDMADRRNGDWRYDYSIGGAGWSSTTRRWASFRPTARPTLGGSAGLE